MGRKGGFVPLMRARQPNTAFNITLGRAVNQSVIERDMEEGDAGHRPPLFWWWEYVSLSSPKCINKYEKKLYKNL